MYFSYLYLSYFCKRQRYCSRFVLSINPLVVRPLLLELAAALELDVEDELDGDEELPPGLGAALGHLRAQGLAEVLDEALQRKLASVKSH